MKNTHSQSENRKSGKAKTEQCPAKDAFVSRFPLSRFPLFLVLCLCASVVQSTPVLFPINTLFGGAAYNQPITLTAANTLISDGQNLWAGTYTIVPASLTNPIVNLYPNTYLLTVAGVVKPARLVVPASTNVLNAAQLITSGPLFYFGTNGLLNLQPGVNITLVTNPDGSLTINSSGGSTSGASATNVFFSSGTNTYFDVLNGSNRFSVPGTAFDAPGAAQNATNKLGGLAFLSALVSNLISGQINIGQVYGGISGSAATNSYDPIGSASIGSATAISYATGTTNGMSKASGLAAFHNANEFDASGAGAAAAQSATNSLPAGAFATAVITNAEPNVALGGSTLIFSNAAGNSATLHFQGNSGFDRTVQGTPAGLVINGGAFIDGSGNLTVNNATINAGGTVTGNGVNLTNTPGSIVLAGANVTVTPSTNASNGQVSYSVASTSGGAGGSATNAVALTNGVATVLTVTSNSTSGNTALTVNGNVQVNGTLSGGELGGGAATNAIAPNGGTGTNLNLTKITTVDEAPLLYATPTIGVFYGDSITQGSYVTNGYVADLAAMGWPHFIAVNNGISSSHLTDVSNYFYGSAFSGALSYTNWLGKPGTNAWVSFWIGINDCLFDAVPLDTNTWISSYTNLWWIAHTNGANPVVVFTIEDSLQLSASGETNRALLNSLIYQNATNDAAWVVLLNPDLILPNTNSTYYLYNASANYGLHPNDYGHSLVAQALASQLVLQTNLARGAYFNGPVWSVTGFGGNGSNLFNLSAGKVVGVLAPTNVPVNTVITAGSGLTVASNSAAGVQTYTVGVGSISAAPSFLSKRVWAYLPNGSGTTLNGFGVSGSVSGSTAGQAETATDPYAMVLSTTTTAGNYSTLGDNTKTITAAKPLLAVWRVGLTNATNVRVWLAVSDYGTLAAADNARSAMGFLYSSTNNGDWKFVTQYSGAYLWTDTGVAADTNSHTFQITYDGSANAYGYIDNTCVATNTSNLLVGYSWAAWATVTALTNTAEGIRFIQFYGEQNF